MVCTKGLRHRWNFAPLCALDSGTGISERIAILCSLKISWSAQSPKLDVDPIRIEFTWPSHHCPAVSHCLTGKQQATSRPKLVPTNNKIQKNAKECQLIPWPTKTKEEIFITNKLLQIPLHFFPPILPWGCLAGHQVHKPRMKHWILHHGKKSTTRILREVTRTLRSTECLETWMITGWSRITSKDFDQLLRRDVWDWFVSI